MASTKLQGKGGMFIPKIRVVDSIMGSGKTTWAIRHMNEHADQKFIFITPYLKEGERIRQACPELDFAVPVEEPTKQAHFHQLLREGRNIAVSHELFKRLELSRPETELVQEQGYTLILDEVLEVLDPVNISKDDLDDLIGQGRLIVGDDGIVRWEGEYSGEFNVLKRQVERNAVQMCGDGELLWIFPVDLLRAFEEVYILTFMFEGSIMEQYLQINDLEVEYCFIANGQLQSGQPDLREIKRDLTRRIEIYDGHLNAIGADPHRRERPRRGPVPKEMPFSRGWIDKNTRNGNVSQAKKNAFNYFNNVKKASGQEAMWSMLMEKRPISKPNLCEHYIKSFCPCNCRASNDYRERSCLAYLVDVYCNPVIDTWLYRHGGCLNKDNFALSQLLQWMWRSRLRDGGNVSIYLPSQRMRELLENWLRV